MSTARNREWKKRWNATKEGMKVGGIASGAVATIAGAAALSNPVGLAATGGACLLFCCIGTCVNYNSDSPTHAMKSSLAEIKTEVDQIGEAVGHHAQPVAPQVEAASDAAEQACCFPLCSLFSRKKRGETAPLVMDEKREEKEMKPILTPVRWHN